MTDPASLVENQATIGRSALDEDGMVHVTINVTVPYAIWQSLTARIPAEAIVEWNADKTLVVVSVDAAMEAFAGGGE